MAVPESQLATWAKQGAVTTSASTYQTVRTALLSGESGYANKEFEIFLQGSYGNDTNIYAESDVDVVIRLDTTFHSDLSELDQAQKDRFDVAFPAATYPYSTFKSDVVKTLRAAFGPNNVTEGPKAVWIKPSGSRRSTDVIVATQYRRYYRFGDVFDQSYTQGICFWSGVEQIINYPQQHSANLTARHQATGRTFKPMARILKNMRTRMVEDGLITDGRAPSYFLEGLLYNVPPDKFLNSYEDTFVAAYNWIMEADRSKFLCANEQYYLLFDHSNVCWPKANGEEFLNKLADFWRGWDP